MSSLHQYTPSLMAIDPRGLTLRTVGYHRVREQDESRARVQRQVFGTTGFLQHQWDARLQALHEMDSSVQANKSQRHSLTGRVLRTRSVDAGWRVALSGNAGQVLQGWDSRGSQQRYEFDSSLRPVAVFEQAVDEPHERCIERLSYAGMNAEHATHNRCGRLIRHDDPAGSVMHEQYGLSGAMTQHVRVFLRPDVTTDWSEDTRLREALLETERNVSAWHYDALGGLLEQTDAKGNRRQSQYGPEGELTQTVLVFKGGARKALLDQRRYNAQGQVESERAGNQVLTEATYSSLDGRLQRLVAHTGGQKKTVLQDLTYTYDRVGNVISIRDAAQPTTWASNSKIEATATFGYDTFYQLIKATGRESAQQANGPALPALALFGAANSTLMRNYTRHYQYDEGGNLMQMRHVPSTGLGYTQTMNIAANSNHSVQDGLGTLASLGNSFDQNGNLRALARGQTLSWNVRNQLARVTQVMREDGHHDEETYRYDGAGQRVLKSRVSQAKAQQLRAEVRYLPGLELHRNHVSGEQFNVLSIEAGYMRVRALVWEHERPSGVADEQLRFSLCDATGSSSLELDEQAALLSQEGYYPYGATAWWAAKNQVEATFKTVRYSGKERDATGLYYYGFRYYAPWLLRWISADPAGDVDTPNLYVMVSNNPVSLVDPSGIVQVGMLERAVLGLAVTGMLAFLGFAAGWVLDSSVEGAVGGAMIGFGLTFMGLLEGYGNYRRRAQQPTADELERRSAEWLTHEAISLAERRGLNRGETDALVNFFYAHRHQYADEGFSIRTYNTRSGAIFGYVGPERAERRLAGLIEKGTPTLKEIRRLGYSTIELRPPERTRVSTPSVPMQTSASGIASQFETQATTQLTRRKTGSTGSPEQGGEPSALTVAVPEARFNIDETAVGHLMQGREGISIGIAIGHVMEGRFAAVRWHQHRDRLWSADLPGYPGSTGRGAHRLMFEHLGGRAYRVVGVRDPHRR
ncbi:RHS repeat-associated core domain-containing protein [Pseudomonas sp. CCC3.1]|uniref:RHS repeat-associated core domain-containing protein n=1 Tax=Pseudomonas sp. CCC3.1 TaxID=3048607 RepID=UPI002AC8A5AE|nr:RHS repeat-associated core domain-containing protein [Pseudomonas sp. CCC3.1]MEB0206601.1 RHS repeat-associated core domain-containing protein [Pseudomonas sp. CCC3.1]WPX34270.1 RHS repeat-associated core domain-containing protein [Pseudomonas sp. CCC3.1]